ncbi:MAG: transposase, partial [Ruminococcus sp.]|nr:transposase [Ruminococcus sp.]
MTRKVKLSDEERIAAVQEYLDGKGSFRSLAMKYGVSYTCIKE